MRIYLFMIILGCLVSFSANAQEKRGRVSAIARSGEKEILLRWAPNDPLTWKLGNKHGYTIERFTIGKNGHIDSTGQWPRVQLTPQPIKPWPLDDWEPIAVKDHYAAIAAQAIYGESFEVDGPSGDMISIINQVKEARNRFGFALFAADHSVDAARASGLRWKDTSVRKGEEYLYRIALAPNPGTIPVDTALVTAEAVAPAPLPKPPEVEAQFGDRTVSVQWNGFYFNHIYVSYRVEKSEDGTHFTPVNDLPIVNGDRPDGESQQVVLMDSLAQNNKMYYYRVRGITAFSEVGPPSAVVSGQGVMSLSGVYPIIDTVLVIDNRSARIQWAFPDSLQEYVVGYQVVRSSSLNGRYDPLHDELLPPASTSYTDKAPLSSSYYRVQAMGPDGSFTGSVPYMIMLEDSLPPHLPVRFAGKVHEDGSVHLHWSESASDDVLGYRLFRANDPQEEFVMVSSETVQDTVFTDSVAVATLTEQVYYRIVAVDRRFNASDYSEILPLKRPDIVPPVPAQLTSLTAERRGIRLSWVASPSADLSEYVLMRWHESSTGYQVLCRFDGGDSSYSFLDSLVRPATTYRYLLRTVDDDGLSAAHSFLEVTALDAPSQNGVKNLSAEANREERRILLQWDFPRQQKVTGYRIFRAVDDGPLRHYRLSGAEPQFADRQLTINRRYRYAVQAVFEDKSESKLSSEVTVNY